VKGALFLVSFMGIPFRHHRAVWQIQLLQYLLLMAKGVVARETKPTFRADIEGLRGIAVLLVLLFHASIPGFKGGFVGVDVFFVISGFLITGMLLREYETTGKVSLSNFYARRVRRLLPASALVLVVTLVASIIFLPPLSIPSVARDVSAAALYVSNIVFAFRATDYFAAGGAPSPILHFWSLGVEEQFYLFWPAIFLFVALGAKKIRFRIGSAVAVIGIASFAFATYLVTRAGPWAFFSLPTRAWELALGAMIAVFGARLSRTPKWIAVLLGWAGLMAVVYSGIFIKITAPFPAWPALTPTLGAAMLIIGGSRTSHLSPAPLLGNRLLQFFGRISYSLYLWHWPLLVLPLALKDSPLNIYERSGLALLAIPFAYATKRWVEDPLRHGKIIGTRPGRNLVTAAAMALVIAGGALATDYVVTKTAHHNIKTMTPEEKIAELNALLNPLAENSKSANSRPDTLASPVPKNLQPQLIDAKKDRPLTYLDRCHTQQNLAPSTLPCLYGDLTSSTTIALFGDSHALSWFPALNIVAKKNSWKLLSLTMSACSPADIPAWDPSNHSVMKNCAIWRADSLRRIALAKPMIVIVAGTRGFATIDAKGRVLKGDAKAAAWRSGMKRTIDQVKRAAEKVIYIGDAPASLVDPPVCLSAHPKNALDCATPVARAIQNDWIGQETAMTIEEGITFIAPDLWICPTSPCPVILGNLLIYMDGGHLTATFSAALASHLRKAISIATGIALPTPSSTPTP
jgi:peptidoglycan/LPS O-acetylase OafA/YrhL